MRIADIIYQVYPLFCQRRINASFQIHHLTVVRTVQNRLITARRRNRKYKRSVLYGRLIRDRRKKTVYFRSFLTSRKPCPVIASNLPCAVSFLCSRIHCFRKSRALHLFFGACCDSGNPVRLRICKYISNRLIRKVLFIVIQIGVTGQVASCFNITRYLSGIRTPVHAPQIITVFHICFCLGV